MPLSHEHVGTKIVAKIKIYILTRAELLFTLCYEIPCMSCKNGYSDKNIVYKKSAQYRKYLWLKVNTSI